MPWTHNLIILSQGRHQEERKFYLRRAATEKWSKRELERQVKGALFERNLLAPPNVSRALIEQHPLAIGVFKDAYMVEFLGLPGGHS